MTDVNSTQPTPPSPEPSASAPSGGFGEIISRFWGFEKLVGSALIKFVYYAGLVVIAIFTLFGLVTGGMMGSMLGGGQTFVTMLVTLVMAVVWVIFWRFVCEMSLLAFMTYNRLGEIRDRLPPR